MNTNTLKERYLHDAEFHTLVDVLMHMMDNTKITPAEIRDATFIAGLKLHELTTRSAFIAGD